MQSTPVNQFGKDHWSTFGYLETTVESALRGTGTPDLIRMRCCPQLHPQFNHSGRWKPEYGTRLYGYFDAKTPAEKAKLQIEEHDDWSCLDDAEEAGLIDNIGTGINRVYKFTPLGHAVANQLREHKRAGGNFSEFVADMVKAQADAFPKEEKARKRVQKSLRLQSAAA